MMLDVEEAREITAKVRQELGITEDEFDSLLEVLRSYISCCCD